MRKLYEMHVLSRTVFLWLIFMAVLWTIFAVGAITHPQAWIDVSLVIPQRGWNVFWFIVRNNFLILTLITIGNLFVRFGTITPGPGHFRHSGRHHWLDGWHKWVYWSLSERCTSQCRISPRWLVGDKCLCPDLLSNTFKIFVGIGYVSSKEVAEINIHQRANIHKIRNFDSESGVACPDVCCDHRSFFIFLIWQWLDWSNWHIFRFACPHQKQECCNNNRVTTRSQNWNHYSVWIGYTRYMLMNMKPMRIILWKQMKSS